MTNKVYYLFFQLLLILDKESSYNHVFYKLVLLDLSKHVDWTTKKYLNNDLQLYNKMESFIRLQCI